MDPKTLSDDELLSRLKVLVQQEREDTAAVVAHLAEADSRELAEDRGYPSLFEYCVRELGYSEPSAYHRIRAARAVQKKPQLLELLRRGEVHLRAVVLLHPHLDHEQADDLVQQARGKSRREVEALLAPLAPVAAPRDTLRVVTIQARPPEGLPLFESESAAPSASRAETRVHVSFLAGPFLLELLQKARQLLWHKHPDGRLEGVFEEALKALLERKDPGLWSSPKRREESNTRKIPRRVRQQVWRRDKGQCLYTAADGRRCGSRDGLEFDHIVPWALGGSSNDPKNIRLLCRSHNQLMARRAGLGRPA